MAKNTQWKGKTHGGTLGQKGLVFLVRFFNISIIYFFLRIVVVFYMIFARKGFLITFHYFYKILKYSYLKSLFKVYQNHYVFGQVILDRFAVFSGIPIRFSYNVEGQEYFTELIENKKGGIIIGSHVGNFELAGYLINLGQTRLNSLIFGGESEEMKKYRAEVLTKNNINLIPISNDMSHIFEINNALRNKELLGITGDRFVAGSQTTKCNFMGKDAHFPNGAFNIAVRFNVPIVFFFVMKHNSKHYKVIVKRFDNGQIEGMNKQQAIDKMTATYAQELENILKIYPEQWFNYFDFWKELDS